MYKDGGNHEFGWNTVAQLSEFLLNSVNFGRWVREIAIKFRNSKSLGPIVLEIFFQRHSSIRKTVSSRRHWRSFVLGIYYFTFRASGTDRNFLKRPSQRRKRRSSFCAVILVIFTQKLGLTESCIQMQALRFEKEIFENFIFFAFWAFWLYLRNWWSYRVDTFIIRMKQTVHVKSFFLWNNWEFHRKFHLHGNYIVWDLELIFLQKDLWNIGVPDFSFRISISFHGNNLFSNGN